MDIHHIALNTTHPADFMMERRHGLPDYLLLNIRSACTFIIDDKIHTVTPPAVILIGSYVPHKYYPIGECYCDDYMHFSVDDSEEFAKKLTFPLNTPISLSQNSSINLLLHSIETERTSASKYFEAMLELYVQMLCIKITEHWELYHHKTKENPHYDDLLTVRTYIHTHPERNHTIEEFADMAHLSPSYFQVMYKKTFGITCITDVIHTKTAQAKQLLTSTNLSIQQISSILGYNEVYHFIRQFKKYTGYTPLSFRKRFLS